MRDRFPLLLIAGLLLLGALGSTILRSAARGELAGPLSTYRSEEKGARALYLLASEEGLPVGRAKQDLELIDEDAAIVLLGVSGGAGGEEHEAKKPAGTGGAADGGTPATSGEELDDLLHERASEQLGADERKRLLEHVKAGHTLVYVPPETTRDDAILQAVGLHLEAPDVKEPKLRTLVPAQPSPFTLGVERVEAEVQSILVGEGVGAIPLLVDHETGGVVAGVLPYGAGRIVALSAPELAMNRALGRADNARLWLSLLEAARGRDRIVFDEYHHGFRDERSIAAFAARYGLHLAIAQLLLGLCLWAGSLKRFGRPGSPPAEARVGGADVLSAAGRLYRAGKHHGFAAQLIAQGLAQDLASPAGLSARAKPEEIEAGLRARGRADLAAGLAEVGQLAREARSDRDVEKVARTATRVRLLLQPRRTARATRARALTSTRR